MNKIARLSALAVVLAASVGTTAFAATSTVTGGYAQSDMQGKANKAGGFNLKYRYEQDNNPLGVIGSFTYTEKDNNSNGTYNKRSVLRHHRWSGLPSERLGKHLRRSGCWLR